MNQTPSSPAIVLSAAAQPAVLHRSLEYAEVRPGLSVFRLRTWTTFSEAEAVCPEMLLRTPPAVFEGFATSEDINKLLSGELATLPRDTELTFVPAELRERAPELAFDDLLRAVPEANKPFTVFESGRATGDDLVRLSRKSHSVSSYEGLPLPQPLAFSYMDGDFSDGAYRLEKALNVLLHRPGIRPRRRAGGAKELSISAVPYYNSRPGCTKTIEFEFIPTDAEMAQMCAHLPAAIERHEARRQAVFELDLLGLRAAGATKFEKYGDSDEYCSALGELDESTGLLDD